nr:MAG TPA: hypothetical protein [Caudoviricetes sp.]
MKYFIKIFYKKFFLLSKVTVKFIIFYLYLIV